MPFSLSEIFGALLWAASAVAVGSYTYDSFKSTYSQFPGIGGESQTVSKLQDQAAKSSADKALGKVGLGPDNPGFKLVRGAANAAGVATWGNVITSQATINPKWDSQFKTAVRARNKSLAIELYKHLRNALDHAMKPANKGYLGAYSHIYSLGLWPQFQKLTGIKPPGQ